MKEAYIRFMAPVVPLSSEKLITIVDDKIRKGYDKLHLLISSPGGSVFHGLALYNFLSGIPLEVDTYNFGSVDSIGVILFCAGKNRYSVPNARFLIHGVSLSYQGSGSFDENMLVEYLKGVQIDQSNIAKIIAVTTGKTEDDIKKDMHARTTLSPEEAKAYGLVTEIKLQLMPPNAEFYSIGEFDTLQSAQPSMVGPAMFPPNFQQVTQQKNENYTSYFDRGYAFTDIQFYRTFPVKQY